jgi:hypothetical protein
MSSGFLIVAISLSVSLSLVEGYASSTYGFFLCLLSSQPGLAETVKNA